MDEDGFEDMLEYVNKHYTADSPDLPPLSDHAKVALCSIAEHIIGVLDWIHETDIDLVAAEFFQTLDEIWAMSVQNSITGWGSGLVDDPIVMFVKRVHALREARQSPELVTQMLASPPQFNCSADCGLRWQPLLWLIDYEGRVAEAQRHAAMMVRLDQHSVH